MPTWRRHRRAHPRAGGENPVEHRPPPTKVGSSPRGRGKPHNVKCIVYNVGLIPARAGKTVSAVLGWSVRAAHPRAGGENCVFCVTSRGSRGSSPRGRGKRHLGGPLGPCRGLIPARAGKTSHAITASGLTWAHPRAGGENWLPVGCPRGLEGSSPRGRGKRRKCRRVIILMGLIPARAGKTGQPVADLIISMAHPRAGGENFSLPTIHSSRLGSSPRGRGKQTGNTLEGAVYGLIPARAGKTALESLLNCTARAHPRAGGENRWAREIGAPMGGSSPRGRGKLYARVCARELVGLIPARAGKTLPRRALTAPPRAHPRAGGENATGMYHGTPIRGSSPRGRGKRRRRIHLGRQHRLIPARAGKTP